MRVSVAMIVRDGASTIERAIASVRPYVDEVVVLDTGSTDATLEILERIGGEPGAPIVVERAEWTDYADARTRSFALASHPWVLWLDDDEIVEGGALIRPMLVGLTDEVSYVFVRADVPDRLANRLKLTWRSRIARRDRCSWEGVVHEVIVPDDELAFAVASPALRVVHAPVDADGRHDHFAPTMTAIEPAGAPPRLLPHAAQELLNRGRVADAIAVYRRFLALTAGQFSELRLSAIERLGTALASSGDVLGGISAMQQRDTERSLWAMRAAAGELEGIERLGPGWLDELPWHPSKSGRNEPCTCGSGEKSKRCERIVFTAAELLARVPVGCVS